jgi:hypothetical protein
MDGSYCVLRFDFSKTVLIANETPTALSQLSICFAAGGVGGFEISNRRPPICQEDLHQRLSIFENRFSLVQIFLTNRPVGGLQI